MKRMRITTLLLALTMLSLTSCLKHGYEELVNSSEKKLTAVDYTYRFLYNDTLQKGTPKQEILTDRVCEVIFKKVSKPIEVDGRKGFSTTITHDINSVMKAGPTGSVTRQMLYNDFKKLIEKDQVSKLWVYITVSDASRVNPINGAPELGKPGDFSKDHIYQVVAADGSSQEYILQLVKGF